MFPPPSFFRRNLQLNRFCDKRPQTEGRGGCGEGGGGGGDQVSAVSRALPKRVQWPQPHAVSFLQESEDLPQRQENSGELTTGFLSRESQEELSETITLGRLGYSCFGRRTVVGWWSRSAVANERRDQSCGEGSSPVGNSGI